MYPEYGLEIPTWLVDGERQKNLVASRDGIYVDDRPNGATHDLHNGATL